MNTYLTSPFHTFITEKSYHSVTPHTEQPVYEEFTLAAGGLVLLAVVVIVAMGIGLRNRFR